MTVESTTVEAAESGLLKALVAARRHRLLAYAFRLYKRSRSGIEQPRWPKGDARGGQFRSNLPASVEMHARLEPGRLRLRASKRQAFNPKRPATPKKGMTKHETGKVMEEAALDYIRNRLGDPDAVALDRRVSNFPIDIIAPNLGLAIEIKGGHLGVSPRARQWRYTIGEPGPKEKAKLRRMSPEKKRLHNARKMAAILERKLHMVERFSKETGKKFRAVTITGIIDPDSRVIDLFQFKGFHARIGWSEKRARDAYRGSFRYSEKE